MLHIVVPERETFDETTSTFHTTKETKLTLEHSLVSISKWESKWEKPFLSSKDKTKDELLDYIRCMTLTQNVDPYVYYGLSQQNLDDVVTYINSKMTATTFIEDERRPKNREIITSELIYYWMFSFNIPIECQKWHINRLLTLINVCNEKNKPPRKMSRQEILARNSRLNQQRRSKYHTRG